MRRFIALLLASVTLFASSLGGLVPFVSAATNPADNGQALEIAPPVIYQTANPGQTIKLQIFLRNVSKGNLIVRGQANDFTASGEDGTPKLILDSKESDPYSLRDWVSPPSSLLIVPKEIKTMNITVRVPRDASPGGHYGVIRFTATPPELDGTGVSLSASLGALVLLTVNGDIKEDLSVKEFYTNKDGKRSSIFESTPINFVERFENKGNVHEQPTGQVTITNMFGKKVAAVNVNVPPKSVLPGSIRKFEQPLNKEVIGNKKLFGRYRAKLSVTYGEDKKVLTASLAFWIIPYKLIALTIIGLIAAFFVLRFAIRRYNRYILARSRKR